MKRAFRYDGEDIDKQISNYTNVGNRAINYMKKYQNQTLTKK